MDEKKALVVFYSRTGVTRKLAEVIAGRLKCDLEEVLDTRKRAGAVGWLRACIDAGRKKLTVIAEPKRDPAQYDLVFLGTPVWAFTMTPAIRAYVSRHKDSFKQVVFFCTMGGSGDDKTFAAMEQLCAKKPLGVLALKTREVQVGGFGDRVKQFLDGLARPIHEVDSAS